MIDAAVAIALAGDVVVLDVWALDVGTGAPRLGGLRALHVEPRRWWLIDAAAHLARIAAEVGDGGALAAIGGGLMRATLSGPGARDLLSVSGWFDTSGLGEDGVAATVIHHVPVWIAAIGPLDVEVYFAASYTSTLAELWGCASRGDE